MRAVILTAYLPEGAAAVYVPLPGDFLIAADGGYRLAEAAGLQPDAFIGDFDSLSEQALACETVIRVPIEKDDTDTMLAIKLAIARGFSEILILGGIGGRLDHTIANLQSLAYAKAQGADARLVAADNEAFLLAPGAHRIAARPGWKLSLFAWGGDCAGVRIAGAQYSLENGRLTEAFPLGVSNAFAAPKAEISLESGMLLCILSRA